jgi:hypothetical protein
MNARGKDIRHTASATNYSNPDHVEDLIEQSVYLILEQEG